MFTKGHSLVEVLVALALATVVFSGAWTAQWFARQQLQLSFEQLQAITLITELHHWLKGVPSVTQYVTTCQVPCALPAAQAQQLTPRLQFFQQAGLTGLQVCLSPAGIAVSWQSIVPAAIRLADCGDGRQQVRLAW